MAPTNRQPQPQEDAETRAWIREQIRRYERPLIRFAAMITGDWESAQDVVQDTFIRLCAADRQRLRDHAAPWLYRVCRNRALDVKKKDGRMKYPGDQKLDEQNSGAPSPASVVEARQSVSEALQVLRTLPDSQQEVVRLKLQAGLSYTEISEATGHSVSNVGVLLHTALRSIRQKMAGKTPGRLS